MKERVERQKDRMTVITNLRNDSFKPRHWVKIEEILGQTMPTDEDETTLTLELLESWEAFEHTEEIEEVSGQASGEAALEIMLKKVIQIIDNLVKTEFFNHIHILNFNAVSLPEWQNDTSPGSLH